MDPTNDLMLAPNEADPQQLLQDLLAISNAPAASRTGATASTFPSHHTPMPPPIAMPAPMPSAMPTGADPSTGGGTDWRAILRLIAPAVGSLVASGGHQAPAFWSGYQGRLAEMDQQRRQQQQQAENKRKAAGDFLMQIEHGAEGYDDPTQLAQYLDAADQAGALSGFTKPGDLKHKYTVSPNKLAEKKLGELTDLLAAAEKNYNLDDLAASGAVLTTKDGSHVPVATAMDLTRRRPLDAQGKPIARPAKAASTEEERFLQQRAKDYGYKSLDAVDADTQLSWRTDFRDAGRASAGTPEQQAIDLKQQIGDATARGDKAAAAAAQTKLDNLLGGVKAVRTASRDPQLDDIALQMKQLQLDALRQKNKDASATADSIQPGSKEYKVAEDLASGRLTFGQLRTLYSYSRDVNKKLSIYDKASEINPNFSPAAFEMGYKFASNPKIQQQVASVNNVMSGIPDLLKASDAAARMGATALNRVVLPGGVALGGRKYTDFKTAQTAFADELSGALGYGSATDMSREMGFNMTDPAMSPDNFRSAIETIILPFVQRKKASLLGPMGPYGTPANNPAANDPTPTAAPIKVGGFTVVVK